MPSNRIFLIFDFIDTANLYLTLPKSRNLKFLFRHRPGTFRKVENTGVTPANSNEAILIEKCWNFASFAGKTSLKNPPPMVVRVKRSLMSSSLLSTSSTHLKSCYVLVSVPDAALDPTASELAQFFLKKSASEKFFGGLATAQFYQIEASRHIVLGYLGKEIFVFQLFE